MTALGGATQRSSLESGKASPTSSPDSVPTVVMGTESRGSLLGLLVAMHLGIGFAEVRKEVERASDDDV